MSKINDLLMKSRAGLVKVAVTVNAKTGQYQSHRWKSMNDAFKDLMKDIKKQIGKPDAEVEIIDKKSGKIKTKEDIEKDYKERGKGQLLQDFVRNEYKISTGGKTTKPKENKKPQQEKRNNKDIKAPEKDTTPKSETTTKEEIEPGRRPFNPSTVIYNHEYASELKKKAEYETRALQGNNMVENINSGNVKAVLLHKGRKIDIDHVEKTPDGLELNVHFIAGKQMYMYTVPDYKEKIVSKSSLVLKKYEDGVRNEMRAAKELNTKENIKEVQLQGVANMYAYYPDEYDTPRIAERALKLAAAELKDVRFMIRHNKTEGSIVRDVNIHNLMIDSDKNTKNIFSIINKPTPTKKGSPVTWQFKINLDPDGKDLPQRPGRHADVIDEVYNSARKDFIEVFNDEVLYALEYDKANVKGIILYRDMILDTAQFPQDFEVAMQGLTAHARPSDRLLGDTDETRGLTEKSHTDAVHYAYGKYPEATNDFLTKDFEKDIDYAERAERLAKNKEKTGGYFNKGYKFEATNDYAISPDMNSLINQLTPLKESNTPTFSRAVMDMVGLNIPLFVQPYDANTGNYQGLCTKDAKGNPLKIMVKDAHQSLGESGRRSRQSTAFHESMHAKIKGTGYQTSVEEPIVELAARGMMANLYGDHLHDRASLIDAPSYTKLVVGMLPVLKDMPQFADCKRPSDFGKILAQEILYSKDSSVLLDSINREYNIKTSENGGLLPQGYADAYLNKLGNRKEETLETIKERARRESVGMLIEQLKNGTITLEQALASRATSDAAAVLLFFLMDEEVLEGEAANLLM